tara:strand:- start:1793 stop:3349 length:1557 start_codon:yes stop_codon:yes gene_type:complete
MNKTVSINLSNFHFFIDEEAYKRLRSYLDRIKASFAQEQGNDEILQDIESRLAELFNEHLNDQAQVITLKEVNDVIVIMGEPQEFEIDEEPTDEKQSKRTDYKKLYRDGENEYIGGVCAGLQHYLGIHVVWIRLIFLLLLISGVGFWIYIILWIVVPEAKTTSQKLDMMGKPINLDNIEKKVKEGFEEVEKKVKNVDVKEVENVIKDKSSRFFKSLVTILTKVVKILIKVLGVILIIAGASGIAAICIGLLMWSFLDIGIDMDQIFEQLGYQLGWISIAAFFLISVPMYYLIHLGMRILSRQFKVHKWPAHIILAILFLGSEVFLSTIGIRELQEQKKVAEVNSVELIQTQVTDTISFEILNNHKSFDWNDDFDLNFNDVEIRIDKDKNGFLFSEEVKLTLGASRNEQNQIKIIKTARGKNKVLAEKRAKNIDYQLKSNSNITLIPSFFTSPIENKVRGQKLKLEIRLSPNTCFKLDQKVYNQITYENRRRLGLKRGEMINHTLFFNEAYELKCADCN